MHESMLYIPQIKSSQFTTLIFSITEFMSALVISLEARLQHTWAALTKLLYEVHGPEMHVHIPELSLVLLVVLAVQVFFVFVFKGRTGIKVIKQIKKAENPDLKVFCPFHCMS